MANFENLCYGRQKLWQAVDSLASGTGSIQERLKRSDGFEQLRSFEDQLPMELHRKLEGSVRI